MITNLNGTKKKYLNLIVDALKVVKWYVNVNFAVHPGFKSHTGLIMTMGLGAIQ